MWRRFVATPYNEDAARLWADVRSRHPRFRVAVLADARIAAENRGEVFDDRSRVAAATSLGRLILGSDAFFALVCYRAKAACQARGVPVLPRLLHVLALRTGQVSIGDPVVVAPGVCLPRGRVIIDGLGTTIGGGVVIGPYVTIGLRDGVFLGPTIGPRVRAHTGAKIIGPVTVGDSAEVGANEVVVSDVPARSRCGVAGGLASAEVTSLAAVAVGR